MQLYGLARATINVRSLGGHEDFERLVGSWFLEAHLDDFLDLEDQAKESTRKRTARAQKWLTYYYLLVWVVGRNESKGLAIPSGAVATKREQLLKGHASNASQAYWLERVSLLGK